MHRSMRGECSEPATTPRPLPFPELQLLIRMRKLDANTRDATHAMPLVGFPPVLETMGRRLQRVEVFHFHGRRQQRPSLRRRINNLIGGHSSCHSAMCPAGRFIQHREHLRRRLPASQSQLGCNRGAWVTSAGTRGGQSTTVDVTINRQTCDGPLLFFLVETGLVTFR
jgi:hypothetical protein